MFVIPRKILWPTDFSSLSLKALDYVKGLREVFNAELHIVNVVEMPAMSVLDMVASNESKDIPMSTQLRNASIQKLERIRNEHFKTERVVVQAIVGHAWRDVVKYVLENDIELVAVATHGLTGLSHVIMGSTAERIVQHAPCPVIVLKDKEHKYSVLNY